MQTYDVHFSYNGFIKLEALNEESAAQKAETLLSQYSAQIEALIKTGIGVEIYDILEE